jgi:hypothetical protein
VGLKSRLERLSHFLPELLRDVSPPCKGGGGARVKVGGAVPPAEPELSPREPQTARTVLANRNRQTPVRFTRSYRLARSARSRLS